MAIVETPLASHYLTYPKSGPQLGSIMGPSQDGSTYWTVVDKQPVDGKVRVGFYCMDTPEAAAIAANWRASLVYARAGIEYGGTN